METLLERRARRLLDEAAAAGEFDRPSSRGQPLDLTPDDPNTPPEWRLAYHVLRGANAAPAWIETGKDVRRGLDDLRRSFARHERRMRALRARLAQVRADAFKTEFRAARAAHAAARGEFARRARQVQRDVDRYDSSAPGGAPRAAFRASAALRRFDALWPWETFATTVVPAKSPPRARYAAGIQEARETPVRELVCPQRPLRLGVAQRAQRRARGGAVDGQAAAAARRLQGRARGGASTQ